MTTKIFTKGRHGEAADTSRCRAVVWQDHFYFQCQRKAVVTRGEYGFCRQHDPVEVEKRDAKRRAEYEARRREDRQKWEREKQECDAIAACKTALEQIAAGHNDPRTLAVETLALFDGSKACLTRSG